MKKITLGVVIGLLLGLLIIPVPVMAAFITYDNPDAGYLAATTYIDFSAIPDFTSISSISDGTQTVSFGTEMQKYTAPGTWATWSESPFSQRSAGDTLPIVYSLGETSIMFSLSLPSYIFGFEAEPNPFSLLSMTAEFYGFGDILLGTIIRDVDGDAGARLFAASTDPIYYVIFSSSADWGAGAFRYSAKVPEPSTLLLLGSGLIGLGYLARRRMKK